MYLYLVNAVALEIVAVLIIALSAGFFKPLVGGNVLMQARFYVPLLTLIGGVVVLGYSNQWMRKSAFGNVPTSAEGTMRRFDDNKVYARCFAQKVSATDQVVLLRDQGNPNSFQIGRISVDVVVPPVLGFAGGNPREYAAKERLAPADGNPCAFPILQGQSGSATPSAEKPTEPGKETEKKQETQAATPAVPVDSSAWKDPTVQTTGKLRCDAKLNPKSPEYAKCVVQKAKEEAKPPALK